jgi:hypothetical protein
MAGWPFQRGREPSPRAVGGEAGPDAPESETLRTRIASELRTVDRLQRIARPVVLIVFTLLGLLALLQLYTWSRVEQLTALSQRREERTAAALASMQEAIDKQRVAVDEATQPMTSPGRGHKKVELVAKETPERAAPAAVRELPKPSKTTREPQPAAHGTAPSQAAVRPAPERPATDREATAPPQVAPPARQHPTVEYQAVAANRLDQTVNRPGGESAEVGPNDPHENAEPPVLRVTQADTVIARDHNEIERLRKLGKRDYIEFTLVRSGNRQEVAPDIRLELKKVDSKRLRCAVNIYAEDYEYPTDLGINEPVVFPVRAMWESVELVINKVGKDTVGGYLTARKGVLAAR